MYRSRGSLHSLEDSMPARIEAAFGAAVVAGMIIGFVIGFYVFIIALNTPRGF